MRAEQEARDERVWDSVRDQHMIGSFANTWAKLHDCSKPTVAAKNAVDAPTTVTTISAVSEYSNMGERRHTMKTPAVTIVAAWIRAETGVGPSIASGNQV